MQPQRLLLAQNGALQVGLGCTQSTASSHADGPPAGPWRPTLPPAPRMWQVGCGPRGSGVGRCKQQGWGGASPRAPRSAGLPCTAKAPLSTVTHWGRTGGRWGRSTLWQLAQGVSTRALCASPRFLRSSGCWGSVGLWGSPGVGGWKTCSYAGSSPSAATGDQRGHEL